MLGKPIWLNRTDYPEYQQSRQVWIWSIDKSKERYCVAHFKKCITLTEIPQSARLDIFADTKFRLKINGKYLGTGPVNSGGDFIFEKSLPVCYYSTFCPQFVIGENEIYVEVSMPPQLYTETSRGHGGLICNCEIQLPSETIRLESDASWLCRRAAEYASQSAVNMETPLEQWKNAEETENIWRLEPSPIPLLKEDFLSPADVIVPPEYASRVQVQDGSIRITNGEPISFILDFDKIYAAHTKLDFQGGAVLLEIETGEVPDRGIEWECITTTGDFGYRGMRLQSIGWYRVKINFLDDKDVTITNAGIISVCYPIDKGGSFACSDSELNAIYKLGRHTANICRQSLHLDSVLHQEPLACTGDYFIESLIDYLAFGDTKLSAFDVRRICELLRATDGRMFHTSYSLILVQMIVDNYRFSGDVDVLERNIDALFILMERFNGYCGADGLIHEPPDYMFVDWVEVGEYSMHHPPRALGQTVLNAFYYKALADMVYICKVLKNGRETDYEKRSKLLKSAFHQIFWDEEKQLYCDGLTTPDQGEGQWRPANPETRYYSMHSNTLAVLYDLAPASIQVAVMERVITDSELIQAQMYFMHFVFEAMYKTGLFGKYGIPQIKRWTEPLRECSKGLKEVFGGMNCDYSHAWGATPAYQLPSKFLGLQILEPGWKKIRLSPELFGLNCADIKVPTPFGMIEAKLTKENPCISVPEGIEAEINMGER